MNGKIAQNISEILVEAQLDRVKTASTRETGIKPLKDDSSASLVQGLKLAAQELRSGSFDVNSQDLESFFEIWS